MCVTITSLKTSCLTKESQMLGLLHSNDGIAINHDHIITYFLQYYKEHHMYLYVVSLEWYVYIRTCI